MGQVGLTAAEVVNISAPATAEPLYWFAPVVSGVGMVVLGAAVLRAGVWDGAVRALPLIVGLWMLVVTIPTIAAIAPPPGLAPALALAVWDLLWLGTAVGVLISLRTVVAGQRTRPPERAGGR